MNGTIAIHAGLRRAFIQDADVAIDYGNENTAWIKGMSLMVAGNQGCTAGRTEAEFWMYQG